MINQKPLATILLLTCVLILGIVSACKRQPQARVPSPTEKHYDLKGKVVAVNKSEHTLTIAHEDIKDYMSGMTMPFTVKDDWVYEIATPGNQITATLIVDGTQSWLENVVITEGTSNETEVQGIGPKAGEEVPNYRLVNQDAKPIHLQDYKGKILLLTFIYTRCQDPNQCTLMSANFAALDKQLQAQPELYKRTHLLSVSFDSNYDTPKVLRSYGASFTEKFSDETFSHWEFASGSEDEIKGITKFFGFNYFMDNSSGNEQIVHSLRTAVIGPDGKIVKVYRGNEWKPEDLLKDVEELAKKSE